MKEIAEAVILAEEPEAAAGMIAKKTGDRHAVECRRRISEDFRNHRHAFGKK